MFVWLERKCRVSKGYFTVLTSVTNTIPCVYNIISNNISHCLSNISVLNHAVISLLLMCHRIKDEPQKMSIKSHLNIFDE